MDYSESKEKVKRMQKVIYQIMCDIDDFCTENNIRYYLSGGTCLGAVRHQGFIPWDDDGDLMMPRKDYEKFLQTFPQAFQDKYGVGALSLDPEWVRPYARIWDKRTKLVSTNLNEKEIGIFLDLFPIDGLPENWLKRKSYYKYTRAMRKLNYACFKKKLLPTEKFRVVKKVLGALLRESWASRFSQEMENQAKKYDFDTSKYVAVSMAIHYGEKETIRREAMSRAVRLQFVDRLLPVPIGFDTYLSNLYGDYMKIPEGAEEQGYTHLANWEVSFSDDQDA